MQYNTIMAKRKPSIYNEVEAYFMGDVIASIWATIEHSEGFWFKCR